jgi:uncharacterized coiled-coil DUF342 family protein
MGRADLKAKIRLEGDASGANRAIKSTESGFKKLARSVRTNALAVTAALGSMLGAYKAIEAAGERLGQRRSLERTLNAQGIAIDEFIVKLKGLANNQIATSDLVLASNRALALGISSDDLPGLLEAATKASVALGISATQAFNDITTGVGRASPLILDNLGIVVDAVKVYKDYAAEIGVATEELTKQQKTAALSAAVMRNAGKGAEDFAKAQSKVTVALSQSTAAIKEFYESTLEAVVQNEGFGGALEGTVTTVKNLIGAIRAYDRALKKNAEEMRQTEKAHRDWTYTLDLLTLNINFAWRAALKLGEVTNDLVAIEKEAAENAAKVTKRYEERNRAMLEAIGFLDSYSSAQERAADRTAKIEAALNKEASALSKLAAALGEVTQIELEKELADITKALEEARDSTDASSDAFVRYERIAGEKIDRLKLRIQGLRDGLGDIGEAADDSAKSFDTLGEAIDDTGEEARETGDNFDGLTRSVRDTNAALSQQASQARTTRGELQQLTAVAEALALAEARTELAATQERRKRIRGVSSQRDPDDLSRYSLSPFGTGGRVTVDPDGNLRPA